MRVGFVTTLNFHRYGTFWTALAKDAGADVILPDPQAVAAALREPLVRHSPGAVMQAATAQAIALQDCDLLVVPDLNAGHSATRGGGQDPWISAFPDVLTSGFGLNFVFGVPVRLGHDLEGLAIMFMQRLMQDPGRIQRVWDRHKRMLEVRETPAPGQTHAGTVAVTGQSWLLDQHLVRLAAAGEERVQSQLQLPPSLLRSEGERTVPGLLPSDLEVLGAVSWFARRGGVSEIRFLVDESSGVDTWLLAQARKASHRPVTAVDVASLLPGDSLVEYLAARGTGG